jgi:hypothetical protein
MVPGVLVDVMPGGGPGDGPVRVELDDWYAEQGIAPNPFLPAAAEPEWELHNLTVDPEERHNQLGDAPGTLSTMKSVLDAQREAKRLIPSLRNATP